ncbi:hydroxymethylbilane synthase, partial [Escherichia coli]|nr:hydroxymethylbilane synthase [Escherichia coli]
YMERIRLIGRNSPLSLLQLEQVRKHIQAAFPLLQVGVLARSSRGDALADIPLQTVEGTDFFTADIFQALETGEADIAVHSLKD